MVDILVAFVPSFDLSLAHEIAFAVEKNLNVPSDRSLRQTHISEGRG